MLSVAISFAVLLLFVGPLLAYVAHKLLFGWDDYDDDPEDDQGQLQECVSQQQHVLQALGKGDGHPTVTLSATGEAGPNKSTRVKISLTVTRRQHGDNDQGLDRGAHDVQTLFDGSRTFTLSSSTSDQTVPSITAEELLGLAGVTTPSNAGSAESQLKSAPVSGGKQTASKLRGGWLNKRTDSNPLAPSVNFSDFQPAPTSERGSSADRGMVERKLYLNGQAAPESADRDWSRRSNGHPNMDDASKVWEIATITMESAPIAQGTAPKGSSVVPPVTCPGATPRCQCQEVPGGGGDSRACATAAVNKVLSSLEASINKQPAPDACVGASTGDPGHPSHMCPSHGAPSPTLPHPAAAAPGASQPHYQGQQAPLPHASQPSPQQHATPSPSFVPPPPPPQQQAQPAPPVPSRGASAPSPAPPLAPQQQQQLQQQLLHQQLHAHAHAHPKLAAAIALLSFGTDGKTDETKENCLEVAIAASLADSSQGPIHMKNGVRTQPPLSPQPQGGGAAAGNASHLSLASGTGGANGLGLSMLPDLSAQLADMRPEDVLGSLDVWDEPWGAGLSGGGCGGGGAGDGGKKSKHKKRRDKKKAKTKAASDEGGGGGAGAGMWRVIAARRLHPVAVCPLAVWQHQRRCRNQGKSRRELQTRLQFNPPQRNSTRSLQRKIREQYEEVVRASLERNLTLAQVGRFTTCLVETKAALQQKSDAIQRKFTIAKSLLAKADKSSFDRLYGQIYGLENEQKKLEEDTCLYNRMQEQLRSSRAYQKMVAYGQRHFTLVPSTGQLVERADPDDEEEISFEELLAREKKDAYWENQRLMKQK
eukprot:jgi/Mesvir1/28159/Mv04721-RA.1